MDLMEGRHINIEVFEVKAVWCGMVKDWYVKGRMKGEEGREDVFEGGPYSVRECPKCWGTGGLVLLRSGVGVPLLGMGSWCGLMQDVFRWVTVQMQCGYCGRMYGDDLKEDRSDGDTGNSCECD